MRQDVFVTGGSAAVPRSADDRFVPMAAAYGASQMKSCHMKSGQMYAGADDDMPLCRCTLLGHDAVRKAIADRGFRTVVAIQAALGWSRPGGCATCRTALNYYLLCAWPGTYVSDEHLRAGPHAPVGQAGDSLKAPHVAASDNSTAKKETYP
ncbi:MAG: hypothetical protein EP335_08465 [Alphaproteobacteria bacterium]|nr:MAG: hypothetical protein EP335_08465 [Alphaproteobacteria bacterium]